MIIHTAKFLCSNTEYEKCPPQTMPEYAFIGRSNVGKSSLINMLVNINGLAKTSQTPGKTQLINHFIVNDKWYLVDLPGYGYAKVGKASLAKFEKMIEGYLANRENLHCIFVLIDIRHEPQTNDMNFMRQLGENGLPFVIVFTKADKLSATAVQRNLTHYEKVMKQYWTDMPKKFVTSAEKKTGRDEILNYIDELNLIHSEK
jgi:GTP-binding protein